MKLATNVASLLIAICLLTACSPKAAPTDAGLSVQQLAATIAAATINAELEGTAAATATPLAPVFTPTTQPTLVINTNNANCRTGPGTDRRVVATFQAGSTVDMVARDTADSYWIVQDPTSHELCWVQAQDATPSGSFDGLPEVTPQAVTSPVPNPPPKGAWNFNCDNTTLNTILGWNAPAGPVNGYRIYRQGNQIADVPATQTTFTDKIPFTYGGSMSYSVAAYNDAGLSSQTTWNFHCP